MRHFPCWKKTSTFLHYFSMDLTEKGMARKIAFMVGPFCKTKHIPNGNTVLQSLRTEYFSERALRDRRQQLGESDQCALKIHVYSFVITFCFLGVHCGLLQTKPVHRITVNCNNRKYWKEFARIRYDDRTDKNSKVSTYVFLMQHKEGIGI